MTSSAIPASPPAVRPVRGPLDLLNVLFLSAIHLAGIAGFVLMGMGRVAWQTVVLAVVLNIACSISITGGYHRLFSHLSYRAAWPVRLFYLIFGAASVQNSALNWTSLHRRHHAHCDTDLDPYNAKRGFWWSHVGWVLFRQRRDFSNVPDLQQDPLIRWQHRWYLALVGVFAFAVPMALSALWGDVLGGLLVAACARLVVQYHSTFAINSFAHVLGSKHYSTHGTPRDSWVTALLTLGEGYHDFHHRFPADYRNGVRLRDFDPTKWWVWTLAKLRLARDLRRMSAERIAEAEAAARAAYAN